jgi:hypothetical protein
VIRAKAIVVFKSVVPPLNKGTKRVLYDSPILIRMLPIPGNSPNSLWIRIKKKKDPTSGKK